MRTLKTMFFLAALLFANVARGADCTLRGAVLDAVNTNHQKPQYDRARRALYGLMMCPDGPADYRSRVIFFKFVEQELAHDYTILGVADRDQDWREAAFEGELHYHFEIRLYLDRIVTPDDMPFKSMILRLANRQAISRLGRGAKADVLRSAQTDQGESGIYHHRPQREALGALGFWIDPANEEFNAAEKQEINAFLIAELSKFGPGRYSVMSDAIVDSLAHSDRAEAEQALLDFVQRQPASKKYSALQAAKAVRARVARE